MSLRLGGNVHSNKLADYRSLASTENKSRYDYSRQSAGLRGKEKTLDYSLQVEEIRIWDNILSDAIHCY